MPSLDVVVSVYRETGAPALYAALATIHGRAPLRLAVFLHDGNANPTIAWSPPANVTGGGALAHNRAHHTHDRIFIADSAGKLRNCAGTTCVAFLHAHTASWHNLWPPIEARREILARSRVAVARSGGERRRAVGVPLARRPRGIRCGARRRLRRE